MKVSCDQGVASQVGPESCIGGREIDGEALTGEGAGWALSLENSRNRSADVVTLNGRQQRGSRQRQGQPHTAWSKTPCTRRSISCGSREIPGLTWAQVQARAVNLQRRRRR